MSTSAASAFATLLAGLPESAKDLRLNAGNLLERASLPRETALTVALACARALRHRPLLDALLAEAADLPPERRHAAEAGTVHGRVFMSVGAEEEANGFSPMVANAREMAERLGSRGHPGLDHTLVVLPAETHFSTIPAAVSRGLRWLLG